MIGAALPYSVIPSGARSAESRDLHATSGHSAGTGAGNSCWEVTENSEGTGRRQQ